MRYSVFGRSGSGKRAVVVVNDDAKKDILAQVKLESASRVLFIVTPGDPCPKKVSGPISIPPRSAAVVFEGWSK